MSARTVWVSDLTSKRPILGQDAGFEVGPTLVSSLISAATAQPERTVYVYPDGRRLSTSQFYALARRVAKGIIAAGVEPRQGVCILGANAVEWFAADWGAVLSGTIPAPSYTTNSTAVVSHILDTCNAGISFVDNEDAVLKLISSKAQCNSASLRYIVSWDSTVDLAKYPDHCSYLLTWNEFLELGDAVSDGELERRIALARPETCAKLIFTSGTTGNPKAVMISHDNICWTANSIVRTYQVSAGDKMVSYLPASHIASNALDCVGPIISDMTVHLARADALRGSLIHSLREVRPTIFVAVPRVWEKFHESMLQKRNSMSVAALHLSDWAKRIGTSACAAEDSGQPAPWGTSLAYYLVHANVWYALGLNRARLLFNTASPLSRATNEYFRNFRIKIVDIYGLSESTGPLTYGLPSEYRFGSAGKVSDGIEVKYLDQDSNGEGELCFRARSLFLGYLGDPVSSAEAFDSEGYFHSGDRGKIDGDGFLFITGRAKELLKTSGGENVAPLLIEEALTEALPAISRAVAIGDNRKFISCLLIPHMDDAGELTGPAKDVSADARTGMDAAANAEWRAYVSHGIETANKRAISGVAKVKRFALLTRNFTMDAPEGTEVGELTPTFKLRRKVVENRFASEIEAMYTPMT